MKTPSAEKAVTPPYLPFKTFLTGLAALKGKPAPPRVDKSLFKEGTSLNGGSIYALLPALDFLGLTKDQAPHGSFQTFVDGSDDEKKAALKKILTEKYPDAIKLLNTATMSHFEKGFGFNGVGATVKPRCITFFVHAAKFCGMPMTDYIRNANKVRRERKKPRAPSKLPADKIHIGEGPEREQGAGDSAALKIDGLETMPVPVGLGKTWYVAIAKQHDDSDINKFTEMIKLSLLKSPKKG